MIRSWRHLSRAGKAYAVAQLAGPVAVALIAVGASDDVHAVLVMGIALAAVAAVDTLLVYPAIRARAGKNRR